MAIDTAEDVTQVLDAARLAANERDWALAYGMLLELHDSAACTDEAWTEARFLLGEACWALDDLESARRYYEEAAVGAGEHAGQATARIGELDRLGAAEAEAGDGVGADELTDVVNAAGEALMRKDYDTAIELYQRAYAMPDIDPAIQSVIINGFGESHLALHHYDEAREWYAWLLAQGDSSFGEAAQAGLDEIDRLTAAQEMAADGTKVAELAPVWKAATEAYENDDTDTAMKLYLSVLDNPTLTAKSRCGALFNIAQCHIRRREYDEARARFEEARPFASGDNLAYVEERLGMLERRDEAMHTAGLIPVE
jgi:tetratricopeptide (TPR) repeat protein